MNTPASRNRLQSVTRLVLLVSAAGSVWFMMRTGQQQKSVVLIALFSFWILSPFAGLFMLAKMSKLFSSSARTNVYVLAIAVSVLSLVAYSGLFTIPDTKPAFIYLVVPFTSWAVIVAMYLAVRKKR